MFVFVCGSVFENVMESVSFLNAFDCAGVCACAFVSGGNSSIFDLVRLSTVCVCNVCVRSADDDDLFVCLCACVFGLSECEEEAVGRIAVSVCVCEVDDGICVNVFVFELNIRCCANERLFDE